MSQPLRAASLGEFNQQSSVYRPYFVELYTSQGCSSCPPAEQWLSSFRDHPQLWKTLFPLAFHVSYWNCIGWKDPYSKRAFSQRQYDHLNAKNTGQVYTPQFVINGKEWRGWFDRELGDVFNQPPEKVGVLSVSIKAKSAQDKAENTATATATDTATGTAGTALHLQASFERYSDNQSSKTANQSSNQQASTVINDESPIELHLALVGTGFTTNVTRGENRNKVLKHDFTVLQHQVFTPHTTNPSHFSGEVTIDNKHSGKAEKLVWVAWIVQNHRPIQAVGGL
ncbi:DUF1223 domain-containing protein [Shewanella waksmanii]|uniref:DUF1223 domain-containing protein n=1 Tax=Shewanella waksmanii TaxID=213783 RepID=UPI000560FAE6|nr:DUF1223 domain-containing protein [Shewanella waksmanii]